MAETKMKIEGMSCMHCVEAVRKAINALEGVDEAKVEIGSADVKFDESRVSQADLEAAVVKAGYKVKKD